MEIVKPDSLTRSFVGASSSTCLLRSRIHFDHYCSGPEPFFVLPIIRRARNAISPCAPLAHDGTNARSFTLGFAIQIAYDGNALAIMGSAPLHTSHTFNLQVSVQISARLGQVLLQSIHYALPALLPRCLPLLPMIPTRRKFPQSFLVSETRSTQTTRGQPSAFYLLRHHDIPDIGYYIFFLIMFMVTAYGAFRCIMSSRLHFWSCLRERWLLQDHCAG